MLGREPATFERKPQYRQPFEEKRSAVPGYGCSFWFRLSRKRVVTHARSHSRMGVAVLGGSSTMANTHQRDDSQDRASNYWTHTDLSSFCFTHLTPNPPPKKKKNTPTTAHTRPKTPPKPPQNPPNPKTPPTPKPPQPQTPPPKPSKTPPNQRTQKTTTNMPHPHQQKEREREKSTSPAEPRPLPSTSMARKVSSNDGKDCFTFLRRVPPGRVHDSQRGDRVLTSMCFRPLAKLTILPVVRFSL